LGRGEGRVCCKCRERCERRPRNRAGRNARGLSKTAKAGRQVCRRFAVRKRAIEVGGSFAQEAHTLTQRRAKVKGPCLTCGWKTGSFPEQAENAGPEPRDPPHRISHHLNAPMPGEAIQDTCSSLVGSRCRLAVGGLVHFVAHLTCSTKMQALFQAFYSSGRDACILGDDKRA
jgi:hypothetical protein